MRALGLALMIGSLTLGVSSCGSDSTSNTEPLSLVGTWDFIAFADAGVTAVTTGTWVFGADQTVSVDGTVTYPGEPTDALTAAGTYTLTGATLELTLGAGASSTWTVVITGDDAVITEVEAPPANVITLRLQH